MTPSFGRQKTYDLPRPRTTDALDKFRAFRDGLKKMYDEFNEAVLEWEKRDHGGPGGRERRAIPHLGDDCGTERENERGMDERPNVTGHEARPFFSTGDRKSPIRTLADLNRANASLHRTRR